MVSELTVLYLYNISNDMVISKNTIKYILKRIAFILDSVVQVISVVRFSNILTFIVSSIGPVNAKFINFMH